MGFHILNALFHIGSSFDNVPLTYEVAGEETDFVEGDVVIHTAPSGLQVEATVGYVKFEPSCGLDGAWMAWITYSHNGLEMTAYTGFDSLTLISWGYPQ